MKKNTLLYHKQKKQNGFTMVELIATVAIMIILMAFGAVAVIRHMHNLKFTEMNNHAEEIFIAAQNHLTESKAIGEWDQLDQTIMGTSFNRSEDLSYPVGDDELKTSLENSTKHDWRYFAVSPSEITADTFDPDKSALGIMLPLGSIDETLRTGGTYIIEFDAKTAQVYGVFYTEAKGVTGAALEVARKNDIDPKNYRDKANCLANRSDKLSRFRYDFGGEAGRAAIGYYGGASASDYIAEIKEPQIAMKIVNGPRLLLVVDVKNNQDAAYYKQVEELRDQNLIIKLQSTADKTRSVILDDVKFDTLLSATNLTAANAARTGNQRATTDTTPIDGYGQLSENYSRYVYILDSITDGNAIKPRHFSRFTGTNGLKLGEEIYATASIEGQKDEIAHSNKANSLFASASKWNESGDKIASIKNGRHLENLSDEIAGGQSGVTKAVLDREITWTTTENDDDFFDALQAEATKYFLSNNTNNDRILFANHSPAADRTYYGIYSKTLRELDGKSNTLKHFAIRNSSKTIVQAENNEIPAGQHAGILNRIELSDGQTLSIHDLKIEQSEVTGSANGATGMLLADYSNTASRHGNHTLSIRNVSVLVPRYQMTGEAGGTIRTIGGLVGYIGSGEVEISSSSVKGEAKGSTSDLVIDASAADNVDVGGLIGRAQSAASLTIKHSDVTVSDNHVVTLRAKNGDIGGLIGRVDSEIKKLDIASVGVTGGKNGQISYTGNENDHYVGGLIGECNPDELKAEDCFSSITIAATVNGGSNQRMAVGGFIGKLETRQNKGFQINRCYSAGRTVDSQYKTPADKNIEAASPNEGGIGGFIGWIMDSDASQMGNSSIQNSYTTMSVYCTGGTGSVGGFIGRDDAGSNVTISNCYSTAAVNTAGSATGNMGLFIGSSNGRAAVGANSTNYVLSGIRSAVSAVGGSGVQTNIAKMTSKTNHDGPFYVEAANQAQASRYDTTLPERYEYKTTAQLAGLTDTNDYNKQHVGDWPEAKQDETNIKLTTGNKLTLTFDMDSTQEYVTIRARGEQSEVTEYAVIKKNADGTLSWLPFGAYKDFSRSAEFQYTSFKNGFVKEKEGDSGKTTYTVWLDDPSISGGNATQIFSSNWGGSHIQAGENIYVSVAENITNDFTDTKEETGNTLFEEIRRNEDGTYTAVIASARHLQNLAPEVSAIQNKSGIRITKALQVADIEWNGTSMATTLPNQKYPAYIYEVQDLNQQATQSSVKQGVSVYRGDSANSTIGNSNIQNAFRAINMESGILQEYDGQTYRLDQFDFSYGNNGTFAGLFQKVSNTLTVKNMYFTDAAVVGSDNSSAGVLISNLEGGAVSISNVTVGGSTLSVNSSTNAGGLIGSMSGGTLELSDTHVFAKEGGVIASGDGSSVGGLIGSVSVSNGAHKIQNSSASVLVKGAANIGGFIGNMNGSNWTITNSYVGGHTSNGTYENRRDNILATASYGTSGGFIGSINGYNNRIDNCYSTASVQGSNAGGFIGTWNQGVTITNSYAAGLVSSYPDAENLNSTTIGAFVGVNNVGAQNTSNQYLVGVNDSGMTSSGNHQEVAMPVTWDELSKNTTSGLAYRYDTTLSSYLYPLRAVNTSSSGIAHYGDWSTVRKLTVKYRVTFIDQDGTILKNYTVEQGQGITDSEIDALEEQSKQKFETSNEVLAGWYLQNDGTAPVNRSLFRQVHENITVQARYSSYVTFYFKDPTNENSEMEVLAKNLIYEENGVRKVKVPTRNEYIGDSYRFVGWLSDINNNYSKVTVNADGTVSWPNNSELYAKYEPVGFYDITVHFIYRSENGTAEAAGQFNGEKVANDTVFRLKETEQLGVKTVALPAVEAGVEPVEVYQVKDGRVSKLSDWGYRREDLKTNQSFTIREYDLNKEVNYYVLYEGGTIDYKVEHIFNHTSGRGRSINTNRNVSTEVTAYSDSSVKFTENLSAKKYTQLEFVPLELSEVQKVGFKVTLPPKEQLVAEGTHTVKYDHRSFTITFDTKDGTYLEPVSYLYGQPVAAMPNNTKVTKDGYELDQTKPWTFTFESSEGEAFATKAAADMNATESSLTRMPACNVTATANWVAKTEATIRIDIVQQKNTAKWNESDTQKANHASEIYDYIESINLNDKFTVGQVPSKDQIEAILRRSGKPIGTTSGTSGLYYHFHLNEALTYQLMNTKTVEPDGSTVYTVYYDRDIMVIQFDYFNASQSEKNQINYHEYEVQDAVFIETAYPKSNDSWYNLNGEWKLGHFSSSQTQVHIYYLYEYVRSAWGSKYYYYSDKKVESVKVGGNTYEYNSVEGYYSQNYKGPYYNRPKQLQNQYSNYYLYYSEYNKETRRFESVVIPNNTRLFINANGNPVYGRDSWINGKFGYWSADGSFPYVRWDSRKQTYIYGGGKDPEGDNNYLDIWIGLYGSYATNPPYEWNVSYDWRVSGTTNNYVNGVITFNQNWNLEAVSRDTNIYSRVNYYIQPDDFAIDDYRYEKYDVASQTALFHSTWTAASSIIKDMIPGYTEKFYKTDNLPNGSSSFGDYKIKFSNYLYIYYVKNTYSFNIENIKWDESNAKVQNLLKYLKKIPYKTPLSDVYSEIQKTLYDYNAKTGKYDIWRGVAWSPDQKESDKGKYEYTFTHFGKSGSDTTAWNGGSETMPAYTYQIFAQWDKPKYDVTINPFGAAGSEDAKLVKGLSESDATMKFGTQELKLSDLTAAEQTGVKVNLDGKTTIDVEKDKTVVDLLSKMPEFTNLPKEYTFDHWAYVDDNGREQRFVNSTKIQKPYQIYAVWNVEQPVEYKFEYYDQNGKEIKNAEVRTDGVLGAEYAFEAAEISGYTFIGVETGSAYSPASGIFTNDMKAKPIRFIYRKGADTWDYIMKQVVIYRDVNDQNQTVEMVVNEKTEHTDHRSEVVRAENLAGYILSDDTRNQLGQKTLWKQDQTAEEQEVIFYYEPSETMLNVDTDDADITYDAQIHQVAAAHMPSHPMQLSDDWTVEVKILYNDGSVSEPKNAGIYNVTTELILQKKGGNESHVISRQKQDAMVIKRKAVMLESDSYACAWNAEKQDYLPPVNQEVHQTGFVGTDGVKAEFVPNLHAVEQKEVDNLFTYSALDGTLLENYSVICKYGILTTAESQKAVISFETLYERPDVTEYWEKVSKEDPENLAAWKNPDDLLIDWSDLASLEDDTTAEPDSAEAVEHTAAEAGSSALAEEADADVENETPMEPEAEAPQSRNSLIDEKINAIRTNRLWPDENDPIYAIEGYRFEGWGRYVQAKDENGELLYEDEEKTKPVMIWQKYSLDTDLRQDLQNNTLGNLRLYAKWTPIESE